MFVLNDWLDAFLTRCRAVFGDRLIFIGLQGSQNRGEATETSDIDMVVILDSLSSDDLKTYREMIDSLPFSEKSCGFIAGKRELQHWSKTDLFQFIHDTRPLFGNLTDIIAPPDRNDIKTAVKTSAEALYHAACHTCVHAGNPADALPALYKNVFFILQSLHYLRTNDYIPTKKALLPLLTGTEAFLLAKTIHGSFITPDADFQHLLDFTKSLICDDIS